MVAGLTPLASLEIHVQQWLLGKVRIDSYQLLWTGEEARTGFDMQRTVEAVFCSNPLCRGSVISAKTSCDQGFG